MLLKLTATLLAAVSAAAAPSISFSPDVLPSSGSVVTIKWSGVTSPAAEDIVVVKATLNGGSGAELQPLGWLPVNQTSTWQSGTGVFQFPLVNMRQAVYSFAYVQGKTAVVTSDFLKFASVDEVTQVHIALSNVTGQSTVMWVSNTASGRHQVRWGTSPTALNNTTLASTHTYSAADLCTAPANLSDHFLDPGAIHVAAINHGNMPATTIYYQVGSPDLNLWSDVLTYVTPAALSASTETFISVFGDLGVLLPFESEMEQQPPAFQTLYWLNSIVGQRTTAGKPSTIFHIGDISYARGWAFLWEYFFELIQPVAASAPWMVAIGNHEYDWPGQPFRPSWSDYGTDSAGECGVPYMNRFSMPVAAGTTSSQNLWYSVNVGNIHVALISTEHAFEPGSTQHSWLTADLAAVDRGQYPWLIVMGHRPMYSSSQGDTLVDQEGGPLDQHLKYALQPLFTQYKVDMAMWGHVHAYERTCGFIGNFTCADDDSDGTVHIVVGNAGNVYNPDWAGYLPQTPSLNSPSGGHHVQPEWEIFRTMNFGFSTIQTNATHLTLKLIDNKRGEVHDTLVMHVKSF